MFALQIFSSSGLWSSYLKKKKTIIIKEKLTHKSAQQYPLWARGYIRDIAIIGLGDIPHKFDAITNRQNQEVPMLKLKNRNKIISINAKMDMQNKCF